MTNIFLQCRHANYATAKLYDKLSLLRKGTLEWNESIKFAIDSQDCIVQILGFQEIGRTRDRQWLEILRARLSTEKNATVLSSIFHAIIMVGGLATLEEVEEIFATNDSSRCSAALILLDSINPQDAVRILCGILRKSQDSLLRRVAGQRLAYFGSNVGVQDLLDSINSKEFCEQVDAACALASLHNDIGVRFIRTLLETREPLTSYERIILVSSLQQMLARCSHGNELREIEELNVDESIFARASIWIELMWSTSRCTRPLSEMNENQ